MLFLMLISPVHNIDRAADRESPEMFRRAVHSPLTTFPGHPRAYGGDNDAVPGLQRGIAAADRLRGDRVQTGGRCPAGA